MEEIQKNKEIKENKKKVQKPYKFSLVRYRIHRYKSILTLIILGLTPSVSVSALEPENTFQERQFIKNGDTLLYRILYPRQFDKHQQYPLVFFLHGAGERGNDNQSQLVHGSKLFLDSANREKYPAIVVFPQCPKDSYWSNVIKKREENGKRTFNFTDPDTTNPTLSMQLAIDLLSALKAEKFVDPSRIYVGGLSMGGMGTFEIVARNPNTFAAAFPICGGGYPGAASNYAKNTAFWIFHGKKDDIVPYEKSQKMFDAIRKNGGDAKFTLYPNANHNSWDSAFAEPELLNWIFSHRR
ncbi:prolyl oligopeptidase family serine peptidase [Saccharicrinis sp. FJH54]|uniref:carboxylesterase family protein n=1 Tax=Saccharicrinis sp. FJH54 TaxID=3344665 RepID=UPI0035D45C4C